MDNLTYKRTVVSQKGFTLIELIIYIALVAMFLTGFIYFAWDSIYGREKANNLLLVEQNARAAMLRIGYEINRAKDIESITESELILKNTAGSTTINLANAAINLTSEGSGPHSLTSDQVEVSELKFTDYSSADNNSKNIEVKINLKEKGINLSKKLQAAVSFSESFELKGQFNQARKLAVDLTGAILAPALQLDGIMISNTSSDEITLDKLLISWTGTGGGENVTLVQINGGASEFSGTASSGSTVELTDLVLPIAANAVPMTIAFDSAMTGANFAMRFIMLDGSGREVKIAAGVEVTPTTTPTLTPTTSLTCETFCQSGSYSTGICRKRVPDCAANGDVYQSGGDSYCTKVNPRCCCSP